VNVTLREQSTDCTVTPSVAYWITPVITGIRRNDDDDGDDDDDDDNRNIQTWKKSLSKHGN